MAKAMAAGCVLVWLAMSTVEAQGPETRMLQRAPFVASSTVLIGPGASIGVTVRDSGAARRHGHVIERGVLVDDVAPESPAARAGLKAGDLIVELDDVAVTGGTQFRRLEGETVPGRPVWIWFVRDGVRRTALVTP